MQVEEETSEKSCLKCVAGKYSETGASSIDGCFTCGVGEYSSEGAGFCSTVRAGEEVLKDGEFRVGAKSCTAGYFSTGSVDLCLPCHGGFSNAGASSCTFCGPGKYIHEDGNTAHCAGCDAGKHSETGVSSAEECLPCGVGEYSSEGAGFCSTVKAGEEVRAQAASAKTVHRSKLLARRS
jgi:hypothetical protein